MLKSNTPAPLFNSIDQHKQTVKLEDFAGQYVVLYFYPKDDTPGCTIQANDFTAMADQFNQHNTVVIGVSRDDCQSHIAFIEKFDLKLILLADTDGELCAQFDVLQEKDVGGQKRMGIVRSTFVVNPQGQLIYVEYGVDPKGHADKILQLIKQAQRN